MPSFSIFKIFVIFGTVSTWAEKAFADGRVTLKEAVELAVDLCAIIGIPTDINLPNPATTDDDPTSLEYQEAVKTHDENHLILETETQSPKPRP